MKGKASGFNFMVDEEGLQVSLSFLKPSYTKTPPVTISITLVQ